ncbi:PASTA domain-containing protein [Oryzomonas rubra]|uniref:Uncharacterized protein n=1 Tax=Oryzomonas rubra TaxID=2509454 RepID=A0A5A9X6W7_9BACT|nr:PASTA domain-containing protein [Oryzomonas rubra]KAA0888363.1 hypothetical protein ET418_16665 [Oryzomonas rubra]
MRNFTIITITSLVMSLNGCRLFDLGVNNRLSDDSSSLSEHAPISVNAPINLMPDVVNTDMNVTGQKLASSGFAVMVKRPRIVVTGLGTNRVEYPEKVEPFKAATWNHMIAGQEPAAGIPIHPGSVITLTSGIHHGAGPFRPWMDAHGFSVKIRGESRCLECHTRQYCIDCHKEVFAGK